MALKKASEFQGAKVNIPDAVIDFFESNVFPGTDSRDIDPLAFPSDASVCTDISNLEPVRVFQGRQAVGHFPWGGLIL